MSEKDAEWEASEEFRQLFRRSSVRDILLIVSPPEGGKTLDDERALVEGFTKELGEDVRG